MSAKAKARLGVLLILVGLLVTAFSSKIVFPGLERLLGIETIVGKSNVVYEADGNYYFANPGAMVKWVSIVAIIGIAVSASGIWLSGIRIKFPSKKGVRISN